MKTEKLLTPKKEAELIGFAQDLVRIKSMTGDEEEIITVLEKKMTDIGYDEITVDAMGNLVGRIGDAGIEDAQPGRSLPTVQDEAVDR